MQQFSDSIIVGLLINICAAILVIIYSSQLKKWVEQGSPRSKWAVFGGLFGLAAALFIGTRYVSSINISFSPKKLPIPFPHPTLVRDFSALGLSSVRSSSVATGMFVATLFLFLAAIEKLRDGAPWKLEQLAKASFNLISGTFCVTIFIVLNLSLSALDQSLKPDLPQQLLWATMMNALQILIVFFALTQEQGRGRPGIRLAVNLALALAVSNFMFKVL